MHGGTAQLYFLCFLCELHIKYVQEIQSMRNNQINCFPVALSNHIPTASRMSFIAYGVYCQETAVWKRHLSFGRGKHMLHHMSWGNYSVSGAAGVQGGHKQNLCERLQSEKPCAIYKFRIAFFVFYNLNPKQSTVSCTWGPILQTCM